MNDLYNIRITHPTTGLEYRYDPDHDVFHRVHDYDSANAKFMAQYGWIIWMLILACITFFVCVQTDPELKQWLKTLPPV
jgi:hypothetical protein